MEYKKDPAFWIKILISFFLVQTIGFLFLSIYLVAQFHSLQSSLKQTQDLVDARIVSVGQEMENVLSKQTSLTSNFHYTLQPAPRGKILLTMTANLKSYTNGSAVSFAVTADNGETFLVKTNISNNTLTASVTLPLCNTINIGLVITDNQNTLSQSLAEIKDAASCLTSHLYLTPDLAVKQEGSDLFLSGSYTLLNEYTLDEQQLDMVRLEITQGEASLHTFYFSQDFQNDLSDHQDLHMLLFERIKIVPNGNAPIYLSVRARDKGGYEYYSTCQQIRLNSSGVASPPDLLDADFHLNDN